MTKGHKQRGIVQGCLRGASQCLLGGVQTSRGGGGVSGDEGGEASASSPPYGLWWSARGLKGATGPTGLGGELWDGRCRRKEAPASSSPCR